MPRYLADFFRLGLLTNARVFYPRAIWLPRRNANHNKRATEPKPIRDALADRGVGGAINVGRASARPHQRRRRARCAALSASKCRGKGRWSASGLLITRSDLDIGEGSDLQDNNPVKS